MYDLSICIPARHEEFLARTVQDILEHKKGNTEVIVGLDGEWANPPIKDHPDVTIFFSPVSIGQRAMTNQCVRLSKAKYVMKTDSHCSFDEGFDVKLMADMQDNWTVVPTMRNLHVFNWRCKKCGNEWYQGPTPTFCCKDGQGKIHNEKCDNTTDFERKIVWIAKKSPQSNSYCFDPEPHFQYFGEYTKREQYEKDLEATGLTESMSLQGSCWMLTREKYWELNMGNENFGSWGSQGIQIAASTWLSGGKVIVNHKTWYAHCFRTQGGDFGFPYKLSGNQVQRAKKYAKELFFNNRYEKATRPLSWLVERFWPVKGWTDQDLVNLKKMESGNKVIPVSSVISVPIPAPSDIKLNKPLEAIQNTRKLKKGIIFYTDNRLNLKIAHVVQNNLRKISKETDIPIISVSLKPMPHFGKNIYLSLERSALTMFKQILAGIEASTADILFLTEHDVLYPKDHFDFIPPKKDIFYYNIHVWKLRSDGHALHFDCKQTSGLCAYRELLLKHYRKRVKMVEDNSFNRKMGFEPGTHRRPERVDDYTAETWWSKFPLIDIRHEHNVTSSRWTKDEFRNKSFCAGWKELEAGDEIKGWGKTTDLVKKIYRQKS